FRASGSKRFASLLRRANRLQRAEGCISLPTPVLLRQRHFWYSNTRTAPRPLPQVLRFTAGAAQQLPAAKTGIRPAENAGNRRSARNSRIPAAWYPESRPAFVPAAFHSVRGESSPAPPLQESPHRRPG